MSAPTRDWSRYRPRPSAPRWGGSPPRLPQRRLRRPGRIPRRRSAAGEERAHHLRRRLPGQLRVRPPGAAGARPAGGDLSRHRLDRRRSGAPARTAATARSPECPDHRRCMESVAAGEATGHAALVRDRSDARRRHFRIPLPYPHAHALGPAHRRAAARREALAARPGQDPVPHCAPVSAERARICAGRRATTTTTTGRSPATPASATCTPCARASTGRTRPPKPSAAS